MSHTLNTRPEVPFGTKRELMGKYEKFSPEYLVHNKNQQMCETKTHLIITLT